jgi:hypothetical protein
MVALKEELPTRSACQTIESRYDPFDPSRIKVFYRRSSTMMPYRTA